MAVLTNLKIECVNQRMVSAWKEKVEVRGNGFGKGAVHEGPHRNIQSYPFGRSIPKKEVKARA